MQHCNCPSHIVQSLASDFCQMQLWQGLHRLPATVWPRPAVAATLLHLHKGLTLENINVLWFIREWILPMLVRALGAVYVLRTDSSLLLAQEYWKCRWCILSSFLMIVYRSQRGLFVCAFSQQMESQVVWNCSLSTASRKVREHGVLLYE